MANVLLGLDIGSQSIKAVQLSRDKTTVSLLAAGYIATPSQSTSVNNQKEELDLANSINRLIHDMKVTTTEVVASLPSAKVVTRIITVPIMTDGELASSIQWEAEPYIPMPLSKVKIDYAILDRNEETKKMKILLVAAPISLIEKYMRVMSAAGLTPVALETEMLAMGRSVGESFASIKNMLVTMIGATSIEIGLLHEKELIYSKSYPIGGNTISRAIAEELGFEAAQAEEYKKTYGLEEDKLEGKIAKIISPFFSNIFEEMEKTVVYFKEQYPTEEIATGIVCGGGSRLPGLIMTMTKNLGLDTQLANPFMSFHVDPRVLPIISPDAPIYTIAAGLALKEIE